MSPSGRDEIREPDNSTVDDWLGQRVDRDEELAERLLEETGGDEEEEEEEAERRRRAVRGRRVARDPCAG